MAATEEANNNDYNFGPFRFPVQPNVAVATYNMS